MISPSGNRPRMWRQLPRLMVLFSLLAVTAALMMPLLDDFVARGESEELAQETRNMLDRMSPEGLAVGASAEGSTPDWLLKVRESGPNLASWTSVGGCGVSGATATGGGFKWVGRGVTGGLVDVQMMASQNTYLDGSSSLSFSTRLATNLGYKWSMAATMPFLYNVETVDAFGVDHEAHLPGFGDLSLEATRKLGITNAYSLTLALTAPLGAHDAVRKGVILPQRQQLGSGVMGLSLTTEYTMDFDWGLMIFGGTLGYGGWENSVGDFRAPSASGYMHLGYLLGPLVPSAGLTFTGRFMSDRERNVEVMSLREMFTISPTLGLEWSSDSIAVMISASSPFSFQRMDSWTVGLGVQTSWF